jgi:hypothetical protein
MMLQFLFVSCEAGIRMGGQTQRSRSRVIAYEVKPFYHGSDITKTDVVDVWSRINEPGIILNVLLEKFYLDVSSFSTTSPVTDLSGITRIYFENESAVISAVLLQVDNIVAHLNRGWEPQIYSSFSLSGSIFRDSSEAMHDVVTENFLARIAAGDIINNPCTSTASEFKSDPPLDAEPTLNTSNTSPSVSVSSDYNSITKTYTPKVKLYFGITSTWSAKGVGITREVLSELRQNLPTIEHMSGINAVNDAISHRSSADFDLLVFLGEFNKTTQHLIYTAKRIKKIYVAIKKGKFSKLAPRTYRKWKRSSTSGKAKLTTDIISDAWLEARYAWRPLMYDAQGVVKALNRAYVNSRVTFRGGDNSEDTDEGQFDFTVDDKSYHVEWNSTIVQSARAGLMCQADIGSGASLGLYNVASTVWELVPFSFIVDWFVNTGGLLSKLNYNPNVKTLASWITYRSERKVTAIITITAPDGSESQMNYSFDTKLMDRDDNVEQPALSIDVNLDASKVVDAAALLWRALM